VSTYVYGIVANSHPPLPDGLKGVGDPPGPVRLLPAGELAAVVGEAPDALRPKRRDLIAHQAVLGEAGAEGCVLPMRFGSVAPDDDTVTAVLTERADHYRERLQALDGRVEYNVKASHDEEAVLHKVMSADAEIRALAEANRRSGGGSYEDKLRLGEMVAGAVRAQEAEDAARVQELLDSAAEATSTGPESSGWLVNISFLVHRDAAAKFLDTIEDVRRSLPHLELRVNGPLPPYSFVDPGPAESGHSGITSAQPVE
jgi:hypothetical protein